LKNQQKSNVKEPERRSLLSNVTNTATTTNTEKVAQYEYIFLDSAGSGVPCSQQDLEDRRATQAFLRDIILRVASRIIFVSTKFDQDVQSNIADLISYLNRNHKNFISPQNRVIIVHNMIDINSQDALISRVKKVEDCYIREDIIDGIEPWQKDTNSKAEIYHTRNTTHVFLVNDNHLVNNTYDVWNPQEYNAITIKELLQLLKNVIPQNIILLNRVLQSVNEVIPLFIKEWNNNYVANTIVDKEDTFIYPKSLKEGTNDPAAFQLSGMKYYGYAFVSDSIIDLEGTYAYNSESRDIIVYVRVPGLTKENCKPENLTIKLTRKDNSINIMANIPPPTFDDKFIEPPEISLKKVIGKYKCELPDDKRFVMPNPAKLYSEQIECSNGELRVKFQLEGGE